MLALVGLGSDLGGIFAMTWGEPVPENPSPKLTAKTPEK